MYIEVCSSFPICLTKKVYFDFLKSLIFYYRLSGKNVNAIKREYYFKRDKHCSLECACMLSHFVESDSCDHMDYSLPGSSVHGISQARIVERVAVSSSRGSSRPKDRTLVSGGSCIGWCFLYHWAPWEAQSRIEVSKLFSMRRQIVSILGFATCALSCQEHAVLLVQYERSCV